MDNVCFMAKNPPILRKINILWGWFFRGDLPLAATLTVGFIEAPSLFP